MRRILLGLSGLCFILVANTLAAQEITDFKALLQRGSAPKIRVSLSLPGLDATDFATFELGTFGQKTAQNGIDLLTKFMDICVFEKNATDTKCNGAALKLRYTNNNLLDKTPEIQFSPDYSANFVEGATVFVLDPISLVYKLDSTIELTASKSTFTKSHSVTLRLSKGLSTDTFFETPAITPTQLVAVNDVPSDLSIVESKGTLTATWQEDEQVDLEDGSKGLAYGALGLVLEEKDDGGWDQAFPVQSYERENIDNEIKFLAAGTVTASADDKTCDITYKNTETVEPIPNNLYLKADDLKAAGFNVKEASSSSSTLSFSGLSKGQRYAIIIQYQPDSLKRSCLIATPSDGVILTELGGGPEPIIKDPRCFIATAAYGSALDPHINSLRWFRDHVLLITSFGRSLVGVYYDLSPSLAAVIAERPVLRTVTRGILWLPVLLIENGRQYPLTLAISAGLIGLLLVLVSRRRAFRETV